MTSKNVKVIDRNKGKKYIIRIFNSNVRGKVPDISKFNQRHDGKAGHWLETQMGIVHNRNTAPDLYGFEMKNQTTTKTTFGDWSPDYSLFNRKVKLLSRDEFLKIFGSPNPEKEGRYSWSGRPCPKIGGFNDFGQKLEVDGDNNILALYSYKDDKREDKAKIVPVDFQRGVKVIAKWSAYVMKNRVEKKFNQFGWFKCLQDGDGMYNRIVFGDPINFENWIDGVKTGNIFFDSGMYQGNKRPYSQWRASNNYWDSLIKERY